MYSILSRAYPQLSLKAVVISYSLNPHSRWFSSIFTAPLTWIKLLFMVVLVNVAPELWRLGLGLRFVQGFFLQFLLRR